MVEYDPQERELVKTLDKKLIPFLAVLYLSILLDRSVQLNTRLTNPTTRAGLAKDLDMNNSDFSWALISFSIGSILFALPATLTFRLIGSSRWFAICFFSWGLIAATTASTSNFAGFLVTRIFLGIVQAGFVPCILLYVVSFYTKEELATRFSYIISSATAVSSASGLITHYLARADGVMGLAGWQCFPETCHFLSTADRVLAASRGRDGAEDDTNLLITGITKKTKEPIFKFHMIQLLDIVKDPRYWLLALIFFLASVALDCLIILSPEVVVTSFEFNPSDLRNVTGGELDIIISDNDNGNIPAILLSTAPYLLASVVALGVSFHSDNSGERAIHGAIPLLTSSVGFFFMAMLPPKYPGAGPARYFIGLIPAAGGLITAVPSILSYAMEKAQGDTSRATAAALTVVFGNSLGIALAGQPDLFRSSEAPTYPIVCVMCAVSTGLAAALLLLVKWLNQREEDNTWGKAPGLRRLLNDADEAKAWDVELSNLDFLKTEGGYDAGMDSPEPHERWSEDQQFESL
ncbi:hypothetical protein BDEG_21021 [Batrachochytrium dendrobatidis JEL423]|uniref:Major facilitator superfamily (MFS) profile domain-containing protein n=1 Tax=Batrachochytrium dendrobatidis (strain JEL423) TaxID=403673 RepID=A0A177WC24_BATDL|nr:hypothetical protein BDEG_21021 [Batrachochytrium dendrobatidis JEL423]